MPNTGVPPWPLLKNTSAFSSSPAFLQRPHQAADIVIKVENDGSGNLALSG